MIYLITAMIVSTIAMGLAGRTAAFGRLAWAAIAILVVSTVSGARNLDVAVDMLLYGNDMFQRVTEANNFDAAIAAASAEVQDPEIGYVWLNYAVAQLSHDTHLFYFMLAAVCAGAVATATLLLRAYGPTWLMWLTYLCTAYVDSFNLLRQGPALALALLGIALVIRKRYIWGGIIGLSGLLFHLTAVIFVPMWLATVLVRRSSRPQRLVVWVVAITVAISAGASALLDLIGGALSDTKYVYYLEETTHGGIALGFETLYRLIPLLLSIVMITQRLRAQRDDAASNSRVDQIEDQRQMAGPGRYATVTDRSRTRRGRIADDPTSTLIALTALLAIELLILPVRELAFGLYRVPMYFGFARILGYGVIIGSVSNRRLLARTAAAIFVVGYFALQVIGRTGIEYQSALLDAWSSAS